MQDSDPFCLSTVVSTLSIADQQSVGGQEIAVESRNQKNRHRPSSADLIHKTILHLSMHVVHDGILHGWLSPGFDALPGSCKLICACSHSFRPRLARGLRNTTRDPTVCHP